MNSRSLARTLGPWLGFAALALFAFAYLIHFPQPQRHGIESFDLTHYFHPTSVFVHEQLQRGNLPLWNPYQFAGEPFAALQVPGLLYPIGIALAWAVPLERALEAHFVVHTMIAGAFTWLLIARLGLGFGARATAAIAFVYSAPTLFAGIYMVAFQSTHAWLPAIFWALHGLTSTRRAPWAIALAVFVSLAFAGGHVQAFVYEVQFAALFGLYCLFAQAPAGQRARVIGLTAFSGTVALALVSPALLAALELVPHAVRSFDGLSFEQVTRGHTTAAAILRGLAGLPIEQKPMVFTGIRQWTVTQPFVFLPLLALGFTLPGRRREWGFWFCGGALLALLMMGPATPLFSLYYALPTGSWFRIPMRFSFLYAFFLAVLMAFGTEALTRRIPSIGSRRVSGIIGAAVAVAVGINLLGRMSLYYSHPAVYAPHRGGPAELREFLERQPGQPRVFIEAAQVPHQIELLYKFGMMNDVFAVPDYEPGLPADYSRYFSAPSAPPWHGHVSVLPDFAYQPRERLARLLDLMGVRFYAAQATAAAETHAALAAFSGDRGRDIGPLRVYERARANPRAIAVGQVVPVENLEQALDAVNSGGFDPRRDAVVEVDPEGESGTRLADLDSRFPVRAGRAAITLYDTEVVLVDAQCPARCLLVLSDLHFPGWRAEVDGETQEILRANGLYRGVVLSAGMHEVAFRFEPRWVPWGLAGLGIGLLACAAVWISAAAAPVRR
jgi:hypothetical protein